MPNQQEKVKGVVDIVFLVDVTGSMGSCIEALKNNISTFIDVLTTQDANNSCPVKDWRARVVGYRDFEADSEPFVDQPFVADASQLKSQLALLKADGGGDEPESLLDALYKVISIGQTEKGAEPDPRKWRYRSSAARVVVVFTDASYKETMVIPEAKGGTYMDIANLAVNDRIILSIFAPDMPCYDHLAEIDKSEYEAIPVDSDGPQKALERYTADKEHFKKTLTQLARSVSKSAEAPPAL